MKKFLLLLGVFIVSFSGIMVRVSESQPSAIAFYRCIIASSLYLVALKGKLKRFDTKKEALLLSAGIFLALHFYFWISSFEHTTVAGAVIPLMVQPFVTSIIAFLIFGERVNKRQVFATLLVLVGITTMIFLDAKTSLRLSLGDILSLVGTLFLCGFIIIGRYIIPKIGTLNFNTRSYIIASLVLLIANHQTVLQPFPIREWLIFLGLGGGCSFLGYTLINNSLKFFKAGIIAMALVGEPVLSIIWSWILLEEHITIPQALGLFTSILGMTMFFRSKF
ncbi:MAG: hypothetical protein PWQ16_1417 [bacterium]|nr:MAG: Uncharacterized protein XD52_0253 [bacterium 42_11]MDK2872065.1 hypothetical protein [bacterium]